jgi:hypothetical protein
VENIMGFLGGFFGWLPYLIFAGIFVGLAILLSGGLPAAV